MVEEEARERQRRGAVMTHQKLGWKTDQEALPELVPEAPLTGDSRAILAEMFQTNENYIGVAEVRTSRGDGSEREASAARTPARPHRPRRSSGQSAPEYHPSTQ